METYRDTPGFAMYPRVIPRQWAGQLVIESETALESQWRRVGPAPDATYRCEIQARARQWTVREDGASGMEKPKVKADAGRVTVIPFACFYHRRLWPLRRRIMELQSGLAFSLRRGGTFDRPVIAGLAGDLEALDERLWAESMRAQPPEKRW